MPPGLLPDYADQGTREPLLETLSPWLVLSFLVLIAAGLLRLT